MSKDSITDRFDRQARDLRISVTDRCNFRCRYCMPADVFGPDYQFVPREDILSFEEIERLVRIAVPMGIRKIRLTGGEPLLRRGIVQLVRSLSTVEGIEDLAVTTNGTRLGRNAEDLRAAGLDRVTVSLDALDPDVFARMNGVGATAGRIVEGIRKALAAGLGVKVNTVVQRGVNEGEILPLVRLGRELGVTVRFIEFMDVGETNRWEMNQVVPAREVRERIEAEFPLEPVARSYRGEVAQRFRFRDGGGEGGVIASGTEPFCRDCTRLRVSAEGKLFTCLFARQGHDLLGLLRSGESDDAIRNALAGIWRDRDDRYSEIRGQDSHPKPEMSYLGG
ncbi:MAG: GTP 3',8-cyclase MoaA [Akkermansiaceae bacterium]|nr:GTP 3',8-cyclase MoaA [Akkermansiaceae bacterium]